MYRMRPGTGDEFALIMLPVVLLLMLLFNAAKTGKFGLRLSEKIHRLSARIQALIFVGSCLLAAAVGMVLYVRFTA